MKFLIRLAALAEFAFFYAKAVLWSNLIVARAALAPKPRIQPGVLTVTYEGLSERQAAMLANLITMTPGTLSVDLRHDSRELVLHTLYLNESESLRQSIATDYIPRIQKTF